MSWTSIPEFLAMGGYGVYVWGAFGVTALLLAAELLSLRVRRQGLQATHHPLEPVALHSVDYHGAAVGHYRDFGAPHEA